MNVGTLRKQFRLWLEHNAFRVLDPNLPVGKLSPSEHSTIHRLLEVITDDTTIPTGECRAFVDDKTHSTPGALDAYRRAAKVLDEASHRHMGMGFSKLNIEQGDALLHRLFVAYPHAARLPRWAHWAHLSPRTSSLLLEVGAFRLLRHHVLPELLSWYYTTERGWAAIGWTDYPGKTRRD